MFCLTQLYKIKSLNNVVFNVLEQNPHYMSHEEISNIRDYSADERNSKRSKQMDQTRDHIIALL